MNTREITNRYLAIANGLSIGTEAHENFWRVYNEQKAIKLQPLFGDKTIIEKEVTLQKDINDIVDDISAKGLLPKIRRNFKPQFQQVIDMSYVSYHGMTEEYSQKMSLRANLFDNILSSGSLAKNKIRNSFSFTSEETGKVVKIQKGAKVSKVLKHFIKEDMLEEVQIAYSQILNDKLLKGILCISINPMDYLTASVNKSGWTSCYDTMDKGCWCASTLSLVSSPNTVMAYLKADKDEEYGHYRETVEWNNKRWRSFVTLGEDNEVVHFGRNYPYENLTLMEEVKGMIAELTQKKYKSIESDTGILIIETPENMYNDADCGDLYVAMTEKYELSASIYEREVINISPIGAICPICGDSYDSSEFDIQCASCGDHAVCNDCGEVLSEDNRCWIEDDGGYYVCDCCSQDYSYCDVCGEYHSGENMIEYNSCYYEHSNLYGTDYICQYCFENTTRVKECTSCGELTHKDYVREDGTCLCCSPLPIEEEEVEN